MVGLRGKFLLAADCGLVGCRFSFAAAVFGAVLCWLFFVSSGGLGWVEVVAAVFWASLCLFRREGDFVSLAAKKVGMPSSLRIVGCGVRGSGLG